MNDFYTYELAYPESMGGAVFYVGKGRGNRINDHERDARFGRMTLNCRIIRRILAQGEQIVKRKVYENLSEEEAFAHEIQLIAHYGRENLANMKEGGGGLAIPGGRRRIQFAITLSDAEQHLLYEYIASRGEEPTDDNCREAIRRIAYYGMREVLQDYLASRGESVVMPRNPSAPRPLSMELAGPYPGLSV